MSMKIKITMRDFRFKWTEKLIQQAEQIINLTNPQKIFMKAILLSEILF